MGDIIGINRKRDRQAAARRATSEAHPTGPLVDRRREVPTAVAYVFQWDVFFELYRGEHPDLFPHADRSEQRAKLMMREYCSPPRRIPEREMAISGLLSDLAEKEKASFRKDIVKAELDMVMAGGLPLEMAGCLWQQLKGDFDIPQEQQAALWASRYAQYLPGHESPFILDQS